MSPPSWATAGLTFFEIILLIASTITLSFSSQSTSVDTEFSESLIAFKPLEIKSEITCKIEALS